MQMNIVQWDHILRQPIGVPTVEFYSQCTGQQIYFVHKIITYNIAA